MTTPTTIVELASAVNLSDATSAVLAVGGALVGIAVVALGIHRVLRLIK